MKHEYALITSAAATAAALWGTTVATVEVNAIGDRLHDTILMGAATATMWVLTLVAITTIKKVFHFDRAFDIATRATVRALADAANQRQRDLRDIDPLVRHNLN